MFHKIVQVRHATSRLIHRLEMHTVGRHFYDSMNDFQKLALQSTILQETARELRNRSVISEAPSFTSTTVTLWALGEGLAAIGAANFNIFFFWIRWFCLSLFNMIVTWWFLFVVNSILINFFFFFFEYLAWPKYQSSRTTTPLRLHPATLSPSMDTPGLRKRSARPVKNNSIVADEAAPPIAPAVTNGPAGDVAPWYLSTTFAVQRLRWCSVSLSSFGLYQTRPWRHDSRTLTILCLPTRRGLCIWAGRRMTARPTGTRRYWRGCCCPRHWGWVFFVW